jgi:hypothetical protein
MLADDMVEAADVVITMGCYCAQQRIIIQLPLL